MNKANADESDIVLNGEEMQGMCLFCGEPVRPTGGDRHFRTFSLGPTENTVSFTGVAFVCADHIEADGLTGALLGRLAEIMYA